MFTQFFDNFRKASESSLQAGQEVFKQWMQQAQSPSLGAANAPNEWTEAFQKRWSDSAAEALKKHRELVDATYKSGLEVMEQTFRMGEARSLGEQRRLLEELWRRLSDTYKSQTEAQFREFQNATASWLAMAQGGSFSHDSQPTHSQAGQ
jgi:hypothetical protein